MTDAMPNMTFKEIARHYTNEDGGMSLCGVERLHPDSYEITQKPSLVTCSDCLYRAYIEMGKLLFDSVKPTREEIQFVNEETIDIGIEDLLCHPDNPEGGGDIGLLACNVLEYRDMVRAEAEDAKA